MKVIGYVRVSTEEQASGGLSLAAQREKLGMYCQLHEHDMVAVVEDAGASGKHMRRDGLQRVLMALATGESDAVVIAKLDRLTRSLADWQLLIDKYFGEKAGKNLLSVGDSIDTRTAAGRLVLNVLITVSQWERETIGERTRDTLRYKIANGERCGKLRFGYDLAADGKTLVPNPLEQEAIALMHQLREAGESYRRIAEQLNQRNIQTKEGRPWLHTSIVGILSRSNACTAS